MAVTSRDDLERDIRRNHYLIDRAIEARNWAGVQNLAEGLVRLSVLRRAAEPDPPTRHFQGLNVAHPPSSVYGRRIPPTRPARQGGQATPNLPDGAVD